jgi:hypothetical protein
MVVSSARHDGRVVVAPYEPVVNQSPGAAREIAVGLTVKSHFRTIYQILNLKTGHRNFEYHRAVSDLSRTRQAGERRSR